jgi:hypothetical protein
MNKGIYVDHKEPAPQTKISKLPNSKAVTANLKIKACKPKAYAPPIQTLRESEI